MKVKIPSEISLIFKSLLIGIIELTLLRLLLFLKFAPSDVMEINQLFFDCFAVGLKFDMLTLSYLHLLPFVVFSGFRFVAQGNLKLKVAVGSLILILIHLLILTAGIFELPYFEIFANRLTANIFNWFGNGHILFGLIKGDTTYIITLLAALFVFLAVIRLVLRITRKAFEKEDATRKSILFSYLLLLITLFFGMRGQVSRPIRLEDAFFSFHPFINKACVNPIYTLAESCFKKVTLMNNEKALHRVQKDLGIQVPMKNISPIARRHIQNDTARNYNVVMVVMESMNARFLGQFGNKGNLTPNLDLLASKSWSFSSAYSSGIHTYNGIFSSLYGFPALMDINLMSPIVGARYTGLPYALKQRGYQNMFFLSHTRYFDDMSTFLPQNYFDEIFSRENYGDAKNYGPFGVADDWLLNHTIEQINKRKRTKPFFACVVTCSNHTPFIVPPYFKTKIQDKKDKAVAYADWSIGQFMKAVRRQDWYSNTIFIFVADHGRKTNDTYNYYNLERQHIPLIIHAPKILKRDSVIAGLVGQMDIFPSVMHLLKGSYVNNTMGVDVFSQPRRYLHFSSDDKMACLSGNKLWVHHFGAGNSAYQLSGKNEIAYPCSKDSLQGLRNYTYSHLQAMDWIILNNKAQIRK